MLKVPGEYRLAHYFDKCAPLPVPRLNLPYQGSMLAALISPMGFTCRYPGRAHNPLLMGPGFSVAIGIGN